MNRSRCDFFGRLPLGGTASNANDLSGRAAMWFWVRLPPIGFYLISHCRPPRYLPLMLAVKTLETQAGVC